MKNSWNKILNMLVKLGKKTCVVLLGTGMLLLTGCAHYKARPLPRLINTVSDKGVYLAYRALDKADCKTYFDRDIIKKGYRPLQLTIINNTDATYTVSESSLSLPLVPVDVVAKEVHTSTAGRAAGYGTAALFCCLFVIPAIADGIGSAEANEQLDVDFSNKTLRFNGIIRPHMTLNGVVFVPQEQFSEDFILTLFDAKNGTPLILKSIA